MTSKKIHVLFLALSLSLASSAFLKAEEPKKEAAKADKEETELEGKMDKIGGAFRKLKRQIADATKNADSLQLVATIKAASEESVKLIPAKAADVPEADRAKFVADYQAKMKEFLAAVDKLEAALKADKNDEAAKILGELNAMQKDGHKQFKRPGQK